MSISTTLRRAAKLQEKIEAMRAELTQLLDRARKEVAASPVDEPLLTPGRAGRPKMYKRNGGRQEGRVQAPRSRKSARKPSPLRGVKRAASPSGPLAPAVVSVLQSKRKPMSVGDILLGLNARGYQFNSSEPRKNLAARIYRLKGVKQVSAGMFATA